MQPAIVWKCSKLTFFKPKHIKTLACVLQKSYLSQKKAENIYTTNIQRGKMKISA